MSGSDKVFIPEWGPPSHLRDNAPFTQCSKCGRKSWGGESGTICSMLQPNNERCDGLMLSPQEKVVCDEVQNPHSYSVCSCTPRHRNPRPSKTVEDWAIAFHSEVVNAKDALTRLAHSIVYVFATKQHGDLYSNENFVKAVRHIKKMLSDLRIETLKDVVEGSTNVRERLAKELGIRQLKQCVSMVCRCGAKVEIETHGWGPTEHSEPWMCGDCRKRYMELCERQIDESSR